MGKRTIFIFCPFVYHLFILLANFSCKDKNCEISFHYILKIKKKKKNENE